MPPSEAFLPSNGVLSEASQDLASPLLSPGSGRSATVVSEAVASVLEAGSPRIGSRMAPTGLPPSREVEDLKTKLRLLEKKRMEDRERLKTLEKVQMERDRFEGIIQKLQAKYQPQQQEMADLRKRLKAAEAKAEEVEVRQAEHDVAMEMATLDREMAEETAEALRSELDGLKAKAQELELEVDVLREENQALGEELTPEERTSQGWLQMERSNTRLREALLRLRDMTQQQEAELNDQVHSLEEDVRELSSVKEQLEMTKQRLKVSEEGVEELRQQLETALGAEEMIEELTERNMNMGEQISELRATVEDLESLQELSNELEVNHVETEKQMQEEVDYKDHLLAEQARRSARQDEAIEQYEYALARFRELVTSLQSDLDELRATQQLTEAEATKVTHHSRAMMDLNRKLQATASKTQVKTIDLELRRLDAQEAAEHLVMIQLFLPQAFQAERDSILSLLRLRRIAFKAKLVHGLIQERIAGHGTGRRQEDGVFAAFDILDQLTWIFSMSDRFIAAVTACSVESFIKFGAALNELEPVERALNGCIDGLRREEMDERKTAAQLQRYLVPGRFFRGVLVANGFRRLIALMTHLAEVHIIDDVEDYANHVYMRALLMQSQLENTSAAMSLVNDMVHGHVTSIDADNDAAGGLARKLDETIAGSRSPRIALGKIARSLDELRSRSLALFSDTESSFVRCEEVVTVVRGYSRSLGNLVLGFLDDEERRDSHTIGDLEQLIGRATSEHFGVEEEGDSVLSTFVERLRLMNVRINDLGGVVFDLSRTVEFERHPAPWVLCAQDLRAAERHPEDLEEQVRLLRETIYESAKQLKIRDKALEESAVKVELLEARTREAIKRTERIVELEQTVAEGRRREKVLDLTLEARVRELHDLHSERERWKTSASATTLTAERGNKSGRGRPSVEDNDGWGEDGWTEGSTSGSGTSSRMVGLLRKEIHDLQGAVRHLRDEQRHLRFVELHNPSTSSWLHEPLVKPPSSSETRASLVRSEAQDVLYEMVHLVATQADIYDLRRSPSNRLAWRPAHTTPQWHVLRQREQWERWREWKDEVVQKDCWYRLPSSTNTTTNTTTTTTTTATTITTTHAQQKRHSNTRPRRKWRCGVGDNGADGGSGGDGGGGGVIPSRGRGGGHMKVKLVMDQVDKIASSTTTTPLPGSIDVGAGPLRILDHGEEEGL